MRFAARSWSHSLSGAGKDRSEKSLRVRTRQASFADRAFRTSARNRSVGSFRAGGHDFSPPPFLSLRVFYDGLNSAE